jgi:hypothetical protein
MQPFKNAAATFARLGGRAALQNQKLVHQNHLKNDTR